MTESPDQRGLNMYTSPGKPLLTESLGPEWTLWQVYFSTDASQHNLDPSSSAQVFCVYACMCADRKGDNIQLNAWPLEDNNT